MVTTAQRDGLAEGRPDDTRPSNRVFVVHGQNETISEDVVSFLRDHGLEAVILHEQPNMGKHLLTKFIREAELATFAVVLLTDDDTGGRIGEAPAPRARQNVILELGYFLSHLGQENVCALKTPVHSAGTFRDRSLRVLVATSAQEYRGSRVEGARPN